MTFELELFAEGKADIKDGEATFSDGDFDAECYTK